MNIIINNFNRRRSKHLHNLFDSEKLTNFSWAPGGVRTSGHGIHWLSRPIPNSFNFIVSQTSPILTSAMYHKQWIRILLVEATHFLFRPDMSKTLVGWRSVKYQVSMYLSLWSNWAHSQCPLPSPISWIGYTQWQYFRVSTTLCARKNAYLCFMFSSVAAIDTMSKELHPKIGW